MVIRERNRSLNSLEVETQQEELESKVRQIREELQIRNWNISNDITDDEFRRVQAELRKSRVKTGMGSLQVLDQKLTDTLIEKRHRSSLPTLLRDKSEGVDQNITKTMKKRFSGTRQNKNTEDNLDGSEHREKKGNATSRIMKRLTMNNRGTQRRKSFNESVNSSFAFSENCPIIQMPDQEEGETKILLQALRNTATP
mmetsp:Transcript_26083/g.39475  ORF Transcript_26083/g.39475 Transcript_26083/m.39475 type:complete len:198 (+) Transcript_26083:106-699(+)